jgi:hypothetical protein
VAGDEKMLLQSALWEPDSLTLSALAKYNASSGSSAILANVEFAVHRAVVSGDRQKIEDLDKLFSEAKREIDAQKFGD